MAEVAEDGCPHDVAHVDRKHPEVERQVAKRDVL